MLTAEQNYRLLQEIDANRRFFLMVYQQNPQLLECAEMRIRQMVAESAASASNADKTKIDTARMTKQRGISLVELIMFIMIVSIALAGILLVMNVTTKSSADPLIHKQALAIAESLLEEVELMPFTYCDPNDVNAATATGAASCTGGAGGANDQNKGGAALTTPTPPSETRYSTSDPFDNVADYGGFAMNSGNGGIRDITGNVITALNNYSATVAVATINFQGISQASGDAVQITVTVTGPDNVPVTVDGIRTRYAPRAVP